MIATQAGRVLHIGFGGNALPEWLSHCEEVTLDIEPRYKPDIIASITELGDIGTYSAVYCSHILEHLYPQDLPIALAECCRVLDDGGSLIAFVPDLEEIRPTDEIVYESPAGPICGLDMYYGHRASLAQYPHMAHHNGFVQATFTKALEKAGFRKAIVKRLPVHQLMGVAVK